VIGRGFSRALLLALTPEPERLARDLAALEASDLISPRPEPGDPAYVFNQGLTRDVAYSSVLLRRRRELHGRLGAVIEAQAAADPAGAYALLAYHYDLSEHAGKAVEYLLLAGAQAQALYANEEALGLLRRALARLSAPGAPARPEQLLRVRTQLGEVCEASGELAEAESHYRAALALAPTGREQARLYGRIATTWGWRGDDAQAEAAIRQGLALLAADPDPVETARLRRMEATLKLQTGAYGEAIALLEAATPVARAAGALAELEHDLRMLGLAYQLQGQMTPASDALRQALAAAQQRGDPVSAALAHNSLAWLYLQAGDLRPALSHLGEAQAILEARNLRKELPPVYNSLGDAYRAAGQPAPAAAFYAQSRDLAAGAGQALELGQALCGLAALALDAGDRAGAAALLAAAAPMIGTDKELEAQ
jgi:adenylate cyclase